MAAEIVRRKYELRYEPAWLMYCELEQPHERADLIIDNDNFERPRVLKPVGQHLDDGLS